VEILLAVLRAVGTAVCLAIAGVIATRRGCITDGGRKSLAELSMNLLMPTLLFTSLVNSNEDIEHVGMSKLIMDCWILLFMPLVIVGSGIVLGKIAAVCTRCPADFRKACAGSVAFGNSTGMSVTLLQVLGPCLLEQGVISTDPLVILPVYLTLYPMLQWSIGSYLFGISGGEPIPVAVKDDKQESPEKQLAARSTTLSSIVSVRRSVSHLQLLDMDLATHPDLHPLDCTECGPAGHTFSRSFSRDREGVDPESGYAPSLGAPAMLSLTPPCGFGPDLPVCSKAKAPPTGGVLESDSEEYSAEEASSEPDRLSSPETRHPKWVVTLGIIARNALVPPVIGSFLGLVVALIPPVQSLFVVMPQSIGGRAPLSFLFNAMLIIGRASVPLNMFVLGSNLSKGCDFKAVPLATNLGVLVMKMVGQPISIAACIALLSRILPQPDPAVWFVSMIVCATPTANSIMVMVEISGQNKAGVTACIFTQYLAAPFILTAVVSLFLIWGSYLLPS